MPACKHARAQRDSGMKRTCHSRSRAIGRLNLWSSRIDATPIRVSPPTPRTRAEAPGSNLLSQSRINIRCPANDGCIWLIVTCMLTLHRHMAPLNADGVIVVLPRTGWSVATISITGDQGWMRAPQAPVVVPFIKGEWLESCKHMHLHYYR